MCRFFAYRGAPEPLSCWLYESSHSLERQAHAPRETIGASVNVDGTGVAWWEQGDPRPLRYVTERPPWSDPNLPLLAPRLRAGVQIAAVRSATPGIGYGPDHVQPFVWEGLAASHNGWIGGFRGAVGAALLCALPPARQSALGAMNDSAVLFQLLVAAVAGGATLARALTHAVSTVVAVCRQHQQPAILNVVVCDAAQTVAVRYAFLGEPNSLHLSRRAGGRLLASEPLDAGPWEKVPGGSLVELGPGEKTTITPLELEQT